MPSSVPVTLTSLGQHRCQQLADYGAPLAHLALLAVGEVRDDPDDVLGTGRLQCVRHYQQLHDSCVHIPGRFENHFTISGCFPNATSFPFKPIPLLRLPGKQCYILS